MLTKSECDCFVFVLFCANIMYALTTNNSTNKINQTNILTAGGSLGAYEAGVYQALYEMVIKSDKERGFKNKPIVDIVAGTSIGAINSQYCKLCYRK